MAEETTLYVVTYDVPDDRRRGKVHKLLRGYGAWVQFSVFECHLTAVQRLELEHKAGKLLRREVDHLRLYRLCAACRAATVVAGGPPPEKPAVYVW